MPDNSPSRSVTGLRRRPVQQRSKAMVEYLLEAAARVFNREGIDATTNRIADEAGVSIGSLYQYFGDKQGLLHELALRHLSEAEQVFDDAAGNSRRPAYELIERFVHAAVELHRQRAGLHRMMRDHAPRSPELVDRFTQVIERIIGMVENALTRLGTDDAAGRARLIVSAVDSQVHTVLTEDVDDETVRRRTAMVMQQIRALIGKENCQQGEHPDAPTRHDRPPSPPDTPDCGGATRPAPGDSRPTEPPTGPPGGALACTAPW